MIKHKPDPMKTRIPSISRKRDKWKVKKAVLNGAKPLTHPWSGFDKFSIRKIGNKWGWYK